MVSNHPEAPPSNPGGSHTGSFANATEDGESPSSSGYGAQGQQQQQQQQQGSRQSSEAGGRGGGGASGGGDGRVLAVTSGFVLPPPFALMHCDMLQVFTKG